MHRLNSRRALHHVRINRGAPLLAVFQPLEMKIVLAAPAVVLAAIPTKVLAVGGLAHMPGDTGGLSDTRKAPLPSLPPGEGVPEF